MNHETAVAWLKAASWALIVVGVGFGWATFAPLNAGSLLFLDIAILPVDGAETLAQTETKLLMAIVGGLTVGAGAVILAITRKVYVRDPELGGALIFAFLAPWMIVDSIGSVIAGGWFNAVLNAVIFAMVATPVWLAKKTAAPV